MSSASATEATDGKRVTIDWFVVGEGEKKRALDTATWRYSPEVAVFSLGVAFMPPYGTRAVAVSLESIGGDTPGPLATAETGMSIP